jgi:hypothetical protein
LRRGYHAIVSYFYEQPPEERPPGCLDALSITSAVFGILFWPVLAIFVVLADAALIWWLFVYVSPLLGLVAIGLTASVVALYARWERRHFRPPGL